MADSLRNPWTTLRSTPQYENPWIRVTEHDVLNPSGKPGIYGVVHFKTTAIGVVPVHDDGSTVLVGQYRYPLRAYSWEIPEGGGDPAVSPQHSAERELLEETGLMAAHWLEMAAVDLSNSVTDERAVCFVAWSLTEGIAAPEETEELQLRRLPLVDALQMAKRGEIRDAVSVLSLLRLEGLAQEGALPAALLHRLKAGGLAVEAS